jgi:hypothetical protein
VHLPALSAFWRWTDMRICTCWRIWNRTGYNGVGEGWEKGEEGGRDRAKKKNNGYVGHCWSSSLKTKDNLSSLSCHLLQLGELLEWIQRAGNFSDESEMWDGKRFEPRCPKSKEDLLALTALRLNGCNISGIQRRKMCTHPFCFLDCNCTRNLSIACFQLRARVHYLLSHVASTILSCFKFLKFVFF